MGVKGHMNYIHILIFFVLAIAQFGAQQCMEKNPASLTVQAREQFIQSHFLNEPTKRSVAQGLTQLHKALRDIAFPLFDQICDRVSPTYSSGKKISAISEIDSLIFSKGFLLWVTKELRENPSNINTVDLKLSQFYRFPYLTCATTKPEDVLKDVVTEKEEPQLYKTTLYLLGRHNPSIWEDAFMSKSGFAKPSKEFVEKKIDALIAEGHCFDGTLANGQSIIPFLIERGFIDSAIKVISNQNAKNCHYLANLIGKPSTLTIFNSTGLKYAHPLSALIRVSKEMPIRIICDSLTKFIQLGSRPSLPQGSPFMHPLIALIKNSKSPENCAELSPLIVSYLTQNDWVDYKNNSLLNLVAQEQPENASIVLKELLKWSGENGEKFDRNSKNSKGQTVLHSAVNVANKLAIEYLIDDGKVDPTISDHKGLKAAELPNAKKDTALLARLLEYEVSFGVQKK